MTSKLALIAGAGALPRALATAAQEQGRALLIVGIEGQVDPETLTLGRSLVMPLGAAGKLLELLEREGIRELVFAGKVQRPSFRDLKLDWGGIKFVAKVGTKALGDDGIMRAIIEVLEERGIRVVAVDEIMASLLAPRGVLGRHRPDEQAELDIRHGLAVARLLGQADVGQCVVVQQGIVLGLEAIEGTDQLLARTGPLRRGGPGGVLVKIKKPQQERRADLPTVGLTTLRGALAAGLRGMALEAGGTLMLDRNKMIEESDKAGFFLIGVDLPP